MQEPELRIVDEELEKLLKEMARLYRYDFTAYSRESLKRRINRVLLLKKIPSIAELHYQVTTDPDFFAYLVEQITVNVTEMFRNPAFFHTLRQEVFPILAQEPFIRIWHAGCSTGEEVYSLAILLQEANLLNRTLLYGTDLNPHVLQQAKSGLFHVANLKTYSENYLQSGGTSSLSDYYTVRYNQALFSDELRQRMVFSVHNLVSDQSFNEFNLILCRNVLIYFNRDLQDRVFNLFTESLPAGGILALGAKETLVHSTSKDAYTYLNREQKIWMKSGSASYAGKKI
ncbi:protein-glutamate O-methyltransferase CheR [Rufibacter immobilis]|uniref:Protein-glutamate O-methyltransferase CheR n=1 Tax=Rufibacter immobilis TaxID=1348778 RepID=A0A3M9MRY4_9BACT|nr:protein-glutamate O-methyltransferase CheR [Rufibacter immobilis]RNI28261.1 protein-glutamate O-methyltransferase CheR [Rufibacter immobilis]